MGAMKTAAKFIFPAPNIRLLPYLLIIPIVVFQALSLAGCVSHSPGVPDLHIVSLQPPANSSVSMTVRLGYFGICAKSGNDARFKCQSSSGTSAEQLYANLLVGGSNTTVPANSTITPRAAATNNTPTPAEAIALISAAKSLQTQIFISILAGAVVFFLVSLLLLFLRSRAVAKPSIKRPDRWMLWQRWTFNTLFLSVALAFTAALATTETAGALQYTSTTVAASSVTIAPGIALQVLQWMVFAFEVLFLGGVRWLTAAQKVPDVEKF